MNLLLAYLLYGEEITPSWSFSQWFCKIKGADKYDNINYYEEIQPP